MSEYDLPFAMMITSLAMIWGAMIDENYHPIIMVITTILYISFYCWFPRWATFLSSIVLTAAISLSVYILWFLSDDTLVHFLMIFYGVAMAMSMFAVAFTTK